MLDEKKETLLTGVACSPGFAMGKAFLIFPERLKINYEPITDAQIPIEIQRYEKSQFSLIKEMEDLISSMETDSRNIMEILEANLLVASDPVIKDTIISKINSNKKAEAAIYETFEQQLKVFNNIKDEYLKTRSEDLAHIRKRLLYILRQKLTDFHIPKDAIVVAHSLMPNDVVKMRFNTKAIITEIGGISSHVSIMARSSNIPSVIGLQNVLYKLSNDDFVIIDGFIGKVYINPSEETKKIYDEKINKLEEHNERIGKLKDIECQTSDGHRINVFTNIDLREDLIYSETIGADGVGLFRTESLIITKGSLPNLQEQTDYYKNIAEIAYPKPVTIRAFDIGSDKFGEMIPHEELNPALGCRGIRFLLSRKDIFKIQVKAILTASLNKNIKLMLPMISDISEVIEAKNLIEECKTDLTAADISFDTHIPIGIMIETPAAAIMIESYLPHIDFISIGTNDLTQYALGADRNSELVSHVYNPYHPVVFRLIQMVLDRVKGTGLSVTVCGELASYPEALPILISMGIDSLSVAPSFVLETKNLIINTSKVNPLERFVEP